MSKYSEDSFDITNINFLTILTIITASVITLIVLKFNYDLGVMYCNANEIPLDFILPVSGVNFVVGVTITLFVFELIGLYYLCKLLKKIPFFNRIFKIQII